VNKTNKTWTRIEDYQSLKLCRGLGQEPESGLCVMQTVAWFAGEPLSDHPECASRVLTNFAVVVNDGLEDQPRQQLRKLVVALAGSRDDGLDVQRAEFLIVQVATVLLAASLRSLGAGAHRLALATSCAEVVEDIRELFAADPGTPAGLTVRRRKLRMHTAAKCVLKAAERFLAVRGKDDEVAEAAGAVVDAALAGVALDSRGERLAEIIEQAIRLGPSAGGMTGKTQAARCSAKGTPPCPSPSSPASIPELACAGCASTTGPGG